MNEKTMHNEIQLTPEQRAQVQAEELMNKFIEDNGMDAMIVKQIEWKLNDNNAKIAASSNIKAWFETAYELADLRDKGLLDTVPVLKTESFNDVVTLFNCGKISIYEEISSIYGRIKPEDFGPEFKNPFAELWQGYEGRRGDMESAVLELYAWTILEDSVRWASGINTMVLQHSTKDDFVEETV